MTVKALLEMLALLDPDREVTLDGKAIVSFHLPVVGAVDIKPVRAG